MPTEPSEAERFASLFRLHYRDVHSFALRRVGQGAAQDVVAETFLMAWRRLKDVPDPALPWLYQVARYEAASTARGVAREGRLRLVLSRSIASQQETLRIDLVDELSNVRSAFSTLNRSDQEILSLAAWEGLSAKDGAQVLGCSVPAYRVRLHRARRRLASLAEVGGETHSAAGGVSPHVAATDTIQPIDISTDDTEEAR
jgi:RNA polymerase sigma-70 factor, ECF subfamily